MPPPVEMRLPQNIRPFYHHYRYCRYRSAPAERRLTLFKKSPAPAFHAASLAVRRELWDAYALFVAAYRAAAEKLRAGIRDVALPEEASLRRCRLWIGRPARRAS